MPLRTSWEGYLKVSLISVPVKAYSATRDKDIRFHLDQILYTKPSMFTMNTKPKSTNIFIRLLNARLRVPLNILFKTPLIFRFKILLKVLQMTEKRVSQQVRRRRIGVLGRILALVIMRLAFMEGVVLRR